MLSAGSISYSINREDNININSPKKDNISSGEQIISQNSSKFSPNITPSSIQNGLDNPNNLNNLNNLKNYNFIIF